jgi:hypothetical protein
MDKTWLKLKPVPRHLVIGNVVMELVPPVDEWLTDRVGRMVLT